LKHLRLSHALIVRVLIGAFASTVVHASERIELSGVAIAPESITSTSAGVIYIGSATRKVYRAGPGDGIAVPWTESPADGPRSTFGVFADEAAKVLWACAGSVPASTSELYAFDLATGALSARFPLPTPGGICNDIAVTRDGTVFATDSANMQVVRLRKGPSRLEVWAGKDTGAFGDPKGIIDGIAVTGDRVIVNTLVSRKLFSIPLEAGGAAKSVSEIVLDHPLDGPDGMRSVGGNTLLVAESGGVGALAQVTITGNRGSVKRLRKGFERGIVAVTVSTSIAFVLGNRPMKVVAPGEAAQFEAVSVSLGDYK